MEDVTFKIILAIFSSNLYHWNKAANLTITYLHSTMELIVHLDVTEHPILVGLGRELLQRLRVKPDVEKHSFAYTYVQPFSCQQQ